MEKSLIKKLEESVGDLARKIKEAVVNVWINEKQVTGHINWNMILK